MVPSTARKPHRAHRQPSTDRARDIETLRRYARSRDPGLREQLVARYLPLARHIASRYASGLEPFDDLIQVANLGLLRAIDRFDPDRGTGFAAYAVPSIAGEVRRHFRDHGWLVRPPRALQEQALLVDRVADELVCELRRSPTVAEIADRTGLDAEQVLDARCALQAKTPSSPPMGSEEDDGPLERLGFVDDGFRRAEARATLESLYRVLTLRERWIVRLCFIEDLGQAETGRICGVSQMHVSRILRGALEKLRDAAEE